MCGYGAYRHLLDIVSHSLIPVMQAEVEGEQGGVLVYAKQLDMSLPWHAFWRS